MLDKIKSVIVQPPFIILLGIIGGFLLPSLAFVIASFCVGAVLGYYSVDIRRFLSDRKNKK